MPAVIYHSASKDLILIQHWLHNFEESSLHFAESVLMFCHDAAASYYGFTDKRKLLEIKVCDCMQCTLQAKLLVNTVYFGYYYMCVWTFSYREHPQVSACPANMHLSIGLSEDKWENDHSRDHPRAGGVGQLRNCFRIKVPRRSGMLQTLPWQS